MGGAGAPSCAILDGDGRKGEAIDCLGMKAASKIGAVGPVLTGSNGIWGAAVARPGTVRHDKLGTGHPYRGSQQGSEGCGHRNRRRQEAHAVALVGQTTGIELKPKAFSASEWGYERLRVTR